VIQFQSSEKNAAETEGSEILGSSNRELARPCLPSLPAAAMYLPLKSNLAKLSRSADQLRRIGWPLIDGAFAVKEIARAAALLYRVD